MNKQTTLVTRKGQVTIPIEIRQALDLKEGDSVVWHIENDEVHLRRASSIVARTAGILKIKEGVVSYEDERAAVEEAIAIESEARSPR